jgi:lipoyl-dependent peroxiredoxin
MPIALRQAEVLWDGTLAGGAGALSSGSGALDLPVTWASRTEQPDGKTSPEEPLAAAHACCFELTVRARVPSLGKEDLGRNVAKAADLCPVSNALRGNVEITVHDEVDDG